MPEYWDDHWCSAAELDRRAEERRLQDIEIAKQPKTALGEMAKAAAIECRGWLSQQPGLMERLARKGK